MCCHTSYIDDSKNDIIVARKISDGQIIEIQFESKKISIVEKSHVSMQSDTSLLYACSGFFDMQVNGYGGYDYNSINLRKEDITSIISALAKSGTVRHLPTIITGPHDRTCQNLEIISEAVNNSKVISHAIPGIHLEGPYISEVDGPRGAHDVQYVRNPNIQEYREWQEISGKQIKIVTLAPEKPGALKFIDILRGDGVIPSIGHTAANPAQIRKAIDAGALMSTHLGNGSHSLLPRFPNYLWEQIAADELVAGIIADGHHLPQSVMKSIARVKTSEKLILVSDVAVLGGSEPGLHDWNGIDVQVFEDGHLGLFGTEFLAGSGHLLDKCIAQMVNATDFTLGTVVKLCTVNPSSILNEPFKDITTGEIDDLVLFDYKPGDSALHIYRTYSLGSLIYDDSILRPEEVLNAQKY